MPYKYSKISAANLAECDPRLQEIFNFVLEHWDHKVTDGARTIEEQRKNVDKGVSQTMASKHLPNPKTKKSMAVDAVPYPENYAAIEKGLNAIKNADGGMEIAEVYAFMGFVAGVAAAKDIPIRQGTDWNSNRQFNDQTFHDLFHTEIDE